jgi:hypothetical protein
LLGRSRPTRGGSGFCTTSRGNMPVPFLCAIPCSLYTFTRNKH